MLSVRARAWLLLLGIKPHSVDEARYMRLVALGPSTKYLSPVSLSLSLCYLYCLYLCLSPSLTPPRVSETT